MKSERSTHSPESKQGRYVLDSFAVLSLLYGEEGAGEVKQILRQARNGMADVFLHWNNLGEVYYILRKGTPRRKVLEAIALVKALPLHLIEFEEVLWLTAAELKGTFPISYADAFAAATTQVKEAILVTGNPEFEGLEEHLPIHWLAQKKRERGKRDDSHG